MYSYSKQTRILLISLGVSLVFTMFFGLIFSLLGILFYLFISLILITLVLANMYLDSAIADEEETSIEDD